MHESAWPFLVHVGRKTTDWSGDDREGSFLFQHISVLPFSSVAQQFRFSSVSGLTVIPFYLFKLTFLTQFGIF